MIIHQERLKEHVLQGESLRLPIASKGAYLYCLACMDDNGLVNTEYVARLTKASDFAISLLFDYEPLEDIDGRYARVVACPFLRGGDGDVS